MLVCMPHSIHRATRAGAAQTPSLSNAAIRAPRVESFTARVGADCRVLILGTIPSLRSLAERQPYAHPRNLFWRFMGEMFDAGFERPFSERMQRLHQNGIGIWDVLKHCERRGSLDSAIVTASEVPNAIPALLRRRPSVAAIALNGGKAQQAFRRHVLPVLATEHREIYLIDLPSTSPANASIPIAVKRHAWRVLLDWTLPNR